VQYFAGSVILWAKKGDLKMKKILVTFTLIVTVMLGLSSCTCNDAGDVDLFYNALVTVKHTASGTLYFQLDDKTTLRPHGISDSAYGNEQFRALVSYTERDEVPASSDGITFDKSVDVFRLDKILTKQIAASQGDRDDEVYGTAPVEIVNSWANIIEDGYITLVFSGYWGDVNKTHKINLVGGVDSGDPYLLELRHDACDDVATVYDSTRCNGIAAFDLNSLPDTKGETVKLKIRFISFTGEKTVYFEYCTGKTSLPSSQAPDINFQTPGVE
jgi:hypothetical protein